MDRDTLCWLWQKLEREARRVLSRDGSFLEALQALKWEVDRDSHVRAATRALRDRGLSVYDSFVPRIRIQLYAGGMALDLPGHGTSSSRADAQDLEHVNQSTSESLTHELRDAASAVVAASLYCYQLNGIVNEALQTSRAFDRIAAIVESAGYELQICLDLSTYAAVRQSSAVTHFPRYRSSQEKAPRVTPPDCKNGSHLSLSGKDLQFLKELRISPF